MAQRAGRWRAGPPRPFAWLLSGATPRSAGRQRYLATAPASALTVATCSVSPSAPTAPRPVGGGDDGGEPVGSERCGLPAAPADRLTADPAQHLADASVGRGILGPGIAVLRCADGRGGASRLHHGRLTVESER